MDKSISDTLPASAIRADYLGGLALAIGGAVLFSAKSVVAKLLYGYHIDAVTLIAFRLMFALPVFAAIALWQMRTAPPLSTGDRWRVAAMGLIGYYVSSYLDFLGLQYISVGLERLILFLTPTFVLLIGTIFLNQHIGRKQWAALAVSYAGIVLVFLHDLNGRADNIGLGSLLVLGAAISYAIYLLLSNDTVKRLGTLRLVSYAMCASSAAGIGQFFLLRPAALLIQPAPVYLLSLVNGLLCTVMPVFMTMAAVARVGAGTASQAGMIGPVSTLFLGALILGEPVTGWQLGGTALVLAGIYQLSQK